VIPSLDSPENLGKISGMKPWSRTEWNPSHTARYRYLSAFICGFLLLLAGCAGLRSLLAGLERTSWFPLKIGNRWEYRLVSTVELNGWLDTTTVADYHHEIVGTHKLADGRPAFVRVWTSNVRLKGSGAGEQGSGDSVFSQTETTYFRRSNRWVYRYQAPEGPPDSIFGLPPELDQKWRSNGLYYWIAAREDVTLDGRQYLGCWRVTMTEEDTPNSSNGWFASGFGLVRLVTERTFGDRRLRTDYYLTSAAVK
jgi:hypothetical protein